MAIQEVRFLKELSNGYKVYTQKMGPYASIEVFNKNGMSIQSRIKSFNKYNCGNKKVLEQTKLTKKINNGIDTIEEQVIERIYDKKNKLLGIRKLLSFNNSAEEDISKGFMKLKPIEKVIKAGENTIKTILDSVNGIRVRKDYFDEQNKLLRRVWFNKKGLPEFDSAKSAKKLA